MPRRSGRYPWGSGERPYQSLSINEMRKLARSNIKKEAYIKGIEEGGVNPEDKFYENLSHDRIIKAGSIAYRTSSNSREDETGSTYVSFDDESAFNYASWVYNDRGKGYITSYELKKDLKIPSISKMSEVLIDSVMEDSEFYNKSIDEYLKRRGLETLEERVKIKNKLIENPNEALVKMYSSFLKGTSKSAGVLGDKIHEKLKREGYDAVPDLNDVSENFKTPLFIFDRSNALKETEKIGISKYGLPGNFKEKYDVKYLS